MEANVMVKMHRVILAAGVAVSLLAGSVFAQVPTPAAPAAAPIAPMATPVANITPAAATATSDAGGQIMEPVREAIARNDYQAAEQALEQIRQANPNHPGIVLYESLIERRKTGDYSPGTGSVLPRPRPEITPIPVDEIAPTPSPTPVATPVTETAASPEAPAAPTHPADFPSGAEGGLLDNDMVRYGIIGALALVALWVVFSFLKKRRDRPTEGEEGADDEVTPVSGVQTIGGMDDHLADDPSAGLGLGSPGSTGSPAAHDFTQGMPGETAVPEENALGGSAMAGGLAGFSVPGFEIHDDEDDEPAAPKAPEPAPAPAVDDDAPVSWTDDSEPPAASPVADVPEDQPIVEPAETVSFEALGIHTPAPEADAPVVPPVGGLDETVILSADDTPKAPVEPGSSSSLTPGSVDLDDLLNSGTPSQPDEKLPGADDANSQTLSTFVSTPGADNPEDSVEVPPQNQRKPAEGETQSISFDELFGSDDSAPSQPAVEDKPEPAAEELPPTMEVSIEDALAATLGDMEAQSPDAAPPAPEAAPEAAPATGQTGESLDERTERMFADQMDKARNAMAEKNWRQAVHVLSIASALHPENEEAKTMLKEARAEKRKAEESV